MANLRVPIKGKKFGRLKVLKFHKIHKTDSCTYWWCRCECGTVKSFKGSSVYRGVTQSCGCLGRDVTAARSTTHGMKGTLTYSTWRAVLDRCLNPKSKDWANYGGRGIKVTKRWRKFENFLEDLGERPGKGFSIERKNNNGNYHKRNCCWIPNKQQARNRRRPKRSRYRYFEHEGKLVTIHDLIGAFNNITYMKLYNLLTRNKLSVAEALKKVGSRHD